LLWKMLLENSVVEISSHRQAVLMSPGPDQSLLKP
jgi:hypothetical protein